MHKSQGQKSLALCLFIFYKENAMLLDEQQIKEAKERAEQVVNGFTTIRTQQARDAVNLAETLELRNRQLTTLVEQIKKRSAEQTSTGSSDNIFGDISDMFGDNFFKNAGKPGFGFGRDTTKK